MGILVSGHDVKTATRKFIKFILSRLLGMFGFYLSRTRTGMRDVLGQISTLGFMPGTVIDVGVANGTYDLYEAFPESRHFLIEPLEEFQPYLEAICEKYQAEYVIAAADSASGTVKINVHPDLVGTSLLKEEEGAAVDGIEREVPVITIDEISRDKAFKAPFVIKIDAQGGEIKVLDGATEALSKTEIVILEVSLFGFFIDGPEFIDIVNYMKERGFVVYDIFDGRNRPLDNALAQVDIAFARENGPFRKEKSFCSPTQRTKQTTEIKAREFNM